MSSQSRASAAKKGASTPKKSALPALEVRDFRTELTAALAKKDSEGRAWSSATWGVYAFYDFDGEPIYVGQTKERLATRIRRHLTNQRSDAVAMRILDVFEVAAFEMWPIWDLQDFDGRTATPEAKVDARNRLDRAEYAAYLDAIEKSRFKVILNEKIPPLSENPELPLVSSGRLSLLTEEARNRQNHPDVRISRRAENLSRLAAVAYERGEVTDGLRRVIVVQAVRLAYLAAVRLAEVEGREQPDSSAISVQDLIGQVLYEPTDPGGARSSEEIEAAAPSAED